MLAPTAACKEVSLTLGPDADLGTLLAEYRRQGWELAAVMRNGPPSEEPLEVVLILKRRTVWLN